MADNSLQALVGRVSQIAENSPKIQKDVKDIRDAICGTEGIRESIVYLTKQIDRMQRKSTLNKLTNKSSINTNRHIIKNTNTISSTLNKILEQVRRMSGKGSRFSRVRPDTDRGDRKIRELKSISTSIDIIERLRGIKLRDFIFSKKKIKNIRSIISNFLKSFRMFKNQKEVDGTLNFANSSIDLMKKLSKIAVISKPAQIGAKAIQKIFLGGKKDIHGGLLGLFRKISKNERHIRKGKRAMKEILASCGSMLLTSIILTGIAAVSIPAMVGALLMKGVIWLLVGTYKFLSKSSKAVLKGSAVMLIMSASIVSFALGLGTMALATKNMSWKQFGLMMASIGSLTLTLALIGIPYVAGLVALGSATLILMGASLGIFALSIMAWQKVDVKTSMGNIKLAVQGLREAFGLELGKADTTKTPMQRLGGGLMDIAMGILGFGKSFFVMGQLILAAAALGLLYVGIKQWDNFDGSKAIGNIKTATEGLKEAFGLELGKADTTKTPLQRLGGGLMDFAIGILGFGKSFFVMGQLVLSAVALRLLYHGLVPWSNFNGIKATTNIKFAVKGLKDAFGIEDSKGKENLKGKIKKLGGGILDMGVALLQSGKSLVQMATITIATGMADIIRLTLIPWRKFDARPAAKNLKEAFTALKDAFGLEDKKNENLGGKTIRLIGGALDMASTLLASGGVMVKMGTIMLATGLADVIKLNLKPWENYDGTNAVTHLSNTINSLKSLFGLEDTSNGNVGLKIVNTVGSIFDLATSLLQGGSTFVKMGTITLATGLAGKIREYIIPWENYNGTKAINNIESTINGLLKVFSLGEFANDEKEKNIWQKSWDVVKNIGKTIGSGVEAISNAAEGGAALAKVSGISMITKLLASVHNNIAPWENFNHNNAISNITNTLYGLSKISTIKFDTSFNIPFKSTVDTINALDITKASKVVEIFKSFADVKDKPIDAFTKAVDKFSESCSDLIDSLNGFNNSNNNTTSEGNTQKVVENTSKSGVNIVNKDELATAIANAIKSLPVNVRTDISDVKLVINNETGKRVILTLDN